MTNISDQTGLTSSGLAENNRLLETVKASVHFGAFIVTGLFAFLIIATVRHNQELRQNPRYVLLCQHCICVSGFNIMGAAVHGLRGLRWPISRITCWILFDLQVLMARGLMITLTLMSISTCLSICMPLRYPILVQRFHRWVMLVACVLALLNPVVFTVLACAQSSRDHVLGLDTECSTALEGTACIASALALLLLLALLIIVSYVAIYLEGRRAGHFTQSNSKGRRTILIHSLQISLHLLPSIIIISRHQETLPVAVVIFVVFSFAQSLSPVVFGLRCKELREEMQHFLPLFWGNCFGFWYNGSMETISTGTMTSAETRTSIETNTSTCIATIVTPSAIVTECEGEKERSGFIDVTL
ncbi:component of Sp100-rs-like [Pimephales promelas]|nr:component of Sp100-rs-like [Pimephales promelas]